MEFRVVSLENKFSPFYFRTKKAAMAFLESHPEGTLQRGKCSIGWSTWNGKFYEPSNYSFKW